MKRSSLSALEKSEIFTSQEEVDPIIKAHRIRWIILILYVIFAAISTFQWVQYSLISNAVMKYYHVTPSELNWTTNAFVIIWLVMVPPVSFIIEKQGLRIAALVGCFSTAIAAVIKVFSIDPHLFCIVILAQTMTAVSQVFISSLPPKIAVTWFPPNEVSTACSFGVFGMQFGRALGILIPPSVVKDHHKIEEIGRGLYTLCSSVAAAILPVAFIVFLYYPKRPNHAPSQVQRKERLNRGLVTISEFLISLKMLWENKPFLIHTMAYGIFLGVYFAIGSYPNQFIYNHFKIDEKDANKLGIAIVAIGLLSSLLIGPILDRTRKYKGTVLLIYLMCALCMGCLVVSVKCELEWMVYLTLGIFSFFLNAYMAAGIEFAMEITFPSPESTTTGIMFTASYILGQAFTFLLSVINLKLGTIWVLVMLVVMYLTGSLLTYWTENNLKRREAFGNDIVFEKVLQAE